MMLEEHLLDYQRDRQYFKFINELFTKLIIIDYTLFAPLNPDTCDVRDLEISPNISHLHCHIYWERSKDLS